MLRRTLLTQSSSWKPLALLSGLLFLLPGPGRSTDTANINTNVVLAPTLDDLKALQKGVPLVQSQGYAAAHDGGGGSWMWVAGDQSANVAADPQSAIWAAPLSASSGSSGAWKRVYDGAVSVRWFGAKGDGTINDTTALQAAINFCSASASWQTPTLFIPAGTYKITTTLSIPHNRISMVGDGLTTTKISFPGVAGGGLTTASIGSLIPFISNISFVGDSSSGIGIDFSNVSGDVSGGALENVYIETGGNCIKAPNGVFSFLFNNVGTTSFNGHGMLVQCGNTVLFQDCYAYQCGTGKAGYRLGGVFTMISCNGLNQGDFWGVFGSNTAASDGFQNDFTGDDYASVTMIGCNVEDFATGAGAATASAIYLQNSFRHFSFEGGKIDRTGNSTGYHSVIRASGAGIGDTPVILLAPAIFAVGAGKPSGAYLFTQNANVFADVGGTISHTTRTYLQNSGSLTFSTVRSYATIVSTTAYQYFNALTTDLLRTASTTVSGLPSAAMAGAGARSFVTDANSTTFLATAVGGGSNKVPVVSDGTNWLIG